MVDNPALTDSSQGGILVQSREVTVLRRLDLFGRTGGRKRRKTDV